MSDQGLMIYGKGPKDKQFLPLDLGRGMRVKRQVFATIFWAREPDSRGRAEKALQTLRERLTGYKFQLRRA